MNGRDGDRGRDGHCRPPLPPNRTGGFPASGSPFGESPACGGTGAIEAHGGVEEHFCYTRKSLAEAVLKKGLDGVIGEIIIWHTVLADAVGCFG